MKQLIILDLAISEWQSEARKAAEKIERNDFSFVESLWVRYAPTCDIDDLFITEYALEQEQEVNELNRQLAEAANKLFVLLERVKSEKT